MKVCGIIAEYNPFHTGHRYHIEQARQMGVTHIAVVMSTSFVQRGEMAAFDFFTRAKAALENGADLVAALPVVYAMSGAASFCRAGVQSLSLLGCDTISFGCETPTEALMKLKDQCRKALSSPLFAENIHKGIHFARARALTVEQLFGNAEALNDANTALALGYLEENEKLSYPMQPLVVQRTGVSHDALKPKNGFASASFLRTNQQAWTEYLPMAEEYTRLKQAGKTPDTQLTNCVLTALLKCRSLSDWKQTAGVSEGLWNSLYRVAGQAMSAEEILQNCKSKRYPLSLLRRILWSAALGITGEMQQQPVPGIWVFGANEHGYEILANARKYHKEQGISQIVTPKFADFAKAAPDIAAIEQRASDLFSLCCTQGEKMDLYRVKR